MCAFITRRKRNKNIVKNTIPIVKTKTLEEPKQPEIIEPIEEPNEEIHQPSILQKYPKYIFIIPYRNRETHLRCFLNHMPNMLNNFEEDYEILIAHQCDEREFNRGAMKNLGFLYAKEKYPETYKNIIFIFNDVDTMLGKPNMVDYTTYKGVIKHFYGYTFALGGFFSIVGSDFEALNGFPNFWGWGFEDNCIHKRALDKHMRIDRSQFYEINHQDILQFFNGIERKIDTTLVEKSENDNGSNGLSSIQNIKYITDTPKTHLNTELYNTTNITMIDYTSWTIPNNDINIQYETYKPKNVKINPILSPNVMAKNVTRTQPNHNHAIEQYNKKYENSKKQKMKIMNFR